MRAISLAVTVFTAITGAHFASAQDAAQAPDTCLQASKSQAEFIACEHARTDPQIDAAIAAQRQREAAAKPLGSWMVESGPGARITATSDTTDNGGAKLRVICDANSGFSIMFSSAQRITIEPKPITTLLIDGNAPEKVEAERLVREIATPPVIVRHAERVERELLGSHEVALRIDSPDYGTETFHFAFANLAAGEALVLKSCPA